jgi:hypothetical protein
LLLPFLTLQGNPTPKHYRAKENESIEHERARPAILNGENTNVRNPLKEENIEPTLKTEESSGSLIYNKNTTFMYKKIQ